MMYADIVHTVLVSVGLTDTNNFILCLKKHPPEE